MTTDQIYDAISIIDIPVATTEESAVKASAMVVARDDILKLLMERPFDDPEEILWEFRVEMEFLAHSLKSCGQTNPYLIANDYAETILAMIEYPRDE